MSKYICVRHEKLKSIKAVKNRFRHNHDMEYRRNNLPVDKEKTKYNKIGFSNSYKSGNTLQEEFGRMAKCYQEKHKKKLRNDAIRCIETVYTISPNVINENHIVEFTKSCYETHEKYFPNCPFICDVHIDENTIHAHFLTVPYNENGEAFNKSVMNITAMRNIQDDFAKNCQKNHIMVERGISKDKSKNKHQTTYQFFNTEEGKKWLGNKLEEEKNNKVIEVLKSEEVQKEIQEEVEKRKQEEIEKIFRNESTTPEFHGIIGEGTLDDILGL